MSGYYYPPHSSPPLQEDDFAYDDEMHTSQHQQAFAPYTTAPQMMPVVPQAHLYNQPQPFYSPPQQYPAQFTYPQHPAQPWMAPMTPTVPSNYPYQAQGMVQFPQYSEPTTTSPEIAFAGPSRLPPGYLSPSEAGRSRVSRSASFASNASSYEQSDASRGVSPNASEMARYGFRNENGTWTCAYPGC